MSNFLTSSACAGRRSARHLRFSDRGGVVFGLLHAHRHAVASLLCGYVCLRDTGVSDYVGRGVHFCAGMTMTHSAFGTPRVAGRSRLPVAASAERRVAPVIGNPNTAVRLSCLTRAVTPKPSQRTCGRPACRRLAK